jgi:putative tryptophan/tyrosine transport system substrate-binding protein
MMERNAMNSSVWFAKIALLVLTVALAGSGRAAAAPLGQWPTWFKLDTNLARNWEAVEVPGDNGSVLLRRRDESEGKTTRHILSLQSRASSAYDVALSEAARVLEQKHILADILVVNYNDEEGRAQAAIKKAEQNNIDLMFATGSSATAWLWKTYRGGRLPVVTICSKDPVTLGQVKSYSIGTGTNFALTSLNLPVDVQLAYALEVMPKLRNLAILVDKGNISAIETQSEPIAAIARSHGIRVLNLIVNMDSAAGSKDGTSELKSAVSKAVETMRLNDLNLENSLFLITGSTSIFEQMETVNAHASRIPVISMVPETVQSGPGSAVLSIGVSFRSNAFLAAVYAAGILDGRYQVGEMKVGVVTPADIAINFRRARDIGLKIPFAFFESANVIYDNEDKRVRPTDLIQDDEN